MTESEESNGLAGWGLVPKPIVEAVQALNGKILRNSEHLGKMVWPDKPRDVQDLLRMSISDAHKVARASADLRALMTAYAHRVHQPRPVMADLARAQEASPQGIPRRYSQANVDGISELLSDEPDIELILIGFPSLSLADLTNFSGAVGAAATTLSTQDVRPRSATKRKADATAQARADAQSSLVKVLQPIRSEPDGVM
ncbi:hypothetical protein SAMN06295879_0242 [Agreia bicolorata]|uniref:Uncharacterized protein n=1 Tax=Agreia bicolorata TaxID=110935 RepID=A0A1T4WV98_9MICO|nr:hypothetical protein [Agreia bicolorata]SKA80785.1 hypothetical protein SAMN06295879_0242 [Agreia bicolorata]